MALENLKMITCKWFRFVQEHVENIVLDAGFCVIYQTKYHVQCNARCFFNDNLKF
jgi:hypothetical protein